ncbi:hypothetical protein, partial [Mesorhizobium sp.]|uniref:hypothetical protein n=1 Tax=Mesorhizobium sp. TaxID=1871066 RepID=UPI0025F2D9AE
VRPSSRPDRAGSVEMTAFEQIFCSAVSLHLFRRDAQTRRNAVEQIAKLIVPFEASSVLRR